MHDATAYAWLHPKAKPDASSVPSARHPDGTLAFWNAEVDDDRLDQTARREASLARAMSAKTGGSSMAVPAYANHGRWVVECPVCHDSQYAVRDDRRFMCVTCANVAAGGLWRPVAWPKDHKVIEELLDARAHAEHRNWEPGETPKDLSRETARHDLTSPTSRIRHQDEPTDPREHALWAGLSEDDADAWVAELSKREKEAGR